MTRINCSVPVKCLTDEHLLAEHREIIRMPRLAKYSMYQLPTIPDKFCLGRGHVLFFADKAEYICKRYSAIHAECLARGYNVQDYSATLESWNSECKSLQYDDNAEAYFLVANRITERIYGGKLKQYHYYKQAISKSDAVQLLIQ
jgi:hypothetical protein